MYPAIAFTVMLICRLILYFLLRRHRRQQFKLRAKQAELAVLKEKVNKSQYAKNEGEKETQNKSDSIDAEISSSKTSKKARKRSKNNLKKIN